MRSIFRAVIRTPARGTARAQNRMERQLLRGMLRSTHISAEEGRDLIRADMSASGLGRLSNAIGFGSDLKRNRVHYTSDGFSVSGDVHIRGRSERTRGALQIYSEGGEITPTRGWLWIATPEIPKRAGRRKMTPSLYNRTGLDQKIGPLIFRPGRSRGEAVLIVKNVSVDRFGRAGKARRLPKRGRVGETREKVEFIVAFVGIRRTSRSQRFNPRRMIGQAAARQPRILSNEMRKV